MLGTQHTGRCWCNEVSQFNSNKLYPFLLNLWCLGNNGCQLPPWLYFHRTVQHINSACCSCHGYSCHKCLVCHINLAIPPDPYTVMTSKPIHELKSWFQISSLKTHINSFWKNVCISFQLMPLKIGVFFMPYFCKTVFNFENIHDISYVEGLATPALLSNRKAWTGPV